MFRWNYCMEIYATIIVLMPLAASRKYDVQTESQRLYGDDFDTVLKKFRRSPEYVLILKEKYADIQTTFEEVYEYAMHHYTADILKDRITEYFVQMYGPSVTDELSLKVLNKSDNAIPNDYMEQAMQSAETTTSNPIELLDTYMYFGKISTAEERNNYRNVAFEVTGEAIHAMMKSMGPVTMDNMVRYTRLMGREGPTDFTSVKDHRHTISSSTNSFTTPQHKENSPKN